MPLNKPSGNMYPWAWTINYLGGICRHGCNYCYVTHKIAPMLKRYGNDKYYGDVRLIEKELKTRLVKPDDGRVIFVQSCGDLFGRWVPFDVIKAVLDHCNEYPENTYLFQSKNPARFFEWLDGDSDFPPKVIFGTTIETNRDVDLTVNPLPDWCLPPPYQHERFAHIQSIKSEGYHTMISIEPSVDFNVKPFVKSIRLAKPDFVSIGADSQNILKKLGIQEPPAEKIQEFISNLKKFTEVRVKKNLNRLGKE